MKIEKELENENIELEKINQELEEMENDLEARFVLRRSGRNLTENVDDSESD